MKGGANQVKGFGEQFREARLLKDLGIDDVAQTLHIRASFLSALENEQWSELPQAPYAQGLVSNYASFLGLDVEETLEQFQEFVPGQHPKELFTQLDEPLVDHARTKTRSSRALLTVLISVVALVAAWYVLSVYYLNSDPLARFRATAPVPETLVPTTAPVVVPTSEPTLAPAVLPTVASPTAIPLPTVPSPTSEPTSVVPISGVSVRLDAQATCWTQVTVDGEVVYASTMQPGDTLDYSALSQIELTLGNAGGVTLQVNGADRGLAGASGQVVNLSFDADS